MIDRILSFHKALGVIFLALLLLGVWLTYAVFTKKFADYDEVTLKTSNIGLQLPTRADVKIRGVLVGEVLEAKSGATEGAELTLGIYPDKIGVIPANVTGSIVPKTLFGEKYVSLVVPETGASGTLQAHAVIDRTVVSTELESVLSDLYPLLRTVQPKELNGMLNAMATALEGRGAEIGKNLETVDSYLKRINPQIPKLIEDLKLTSSVSDTYSAILPQVAQILEDTVKTTGTLEEKEVAVTTTLRDIRTFSDTAKAWLDANETRLRRAGELSTQLLRVLARYAPTIPCMSKGIVASQGRLGEAFRGFELHIVLETLTDQPQPYDVNDRPKWGVDLGPDCGDTATQRSSQAHPLQIPDRINNADDGVTGGRGRAVPGGSAEGYHGTPDDISALRGLLTQRYDAGSDGNVLLMGPTLLDQGSGR